MRGEDRERGETLTELLVAVMIMGFAVVVLLGGLGTGIRMSDVHRKEVTASAQVRAFAEAIETAVAASPSAYVECATPATYAPLYSTGDPKYTAQVTAVHYWTGVSFDTTCTVATDSGVQQVSLRVRSFDDAAVETLDVIIRKPCRPVSQFPLDAPCV
jgi:type II secretory pathway pseudopilin PulG